MVKKNIIAIALSITVAFFAISSMVYASKTVAFTFTNVGNLARTNESLKSGKQTLKANSLNGRVNATIGLSLDEQTVTGWKFISRCNKSFSDTSSLTCTWNQTWFSLLGVGEYKTFRGTAVLDSVGSDFTEVYGQISLYNS